MEVIWILAGAASVVIIMLTVIFTKTRKSTIDKALKAYAFPAWLPAKIQQKHPHLTEQERHEVVEGLRDYFHLINEANGKKVVSMPSQVVDDAWHEFILSTKEYERFCKQVFGRFIHHHPLEAMATPTKADNGIKLAWTLACVRQSINPNRPTRLPRLFALDQSLKITDGFHYQLDCKRKRPDVQGAAAGVVIYCASHIGATEGSAAGCSGAAGDSADGGGCGGGGCGGS